MKNINFSRVFIGVFVFILIWPIIFYIFFGYFLDWRYFREFNFRDFYSGEYQEYFSNYFKDRLPIYSRMASLKPNADVLTGQAVSNGVFLQEKELIKIHKLPSNKKLGLFCDIVNNFAKNVKIPIFYLIIPSKFQVNGSSFNFYSEYEMRRDIKMFFNNNLNFDVVGLDDAVLFENSKEINSFYRTSSKINSMGAYLLYKSNMKKLGQDAIDLQHFKIFNVVDSYYGELFSKNFIKRVYPDVVDVFKYVKKNVKFNVEEVFNNGSVKRRNTIYDISKVDDFNKLNLVFGSNAPMKKVETNLKGKEHILIFADDFINNFMQFLSLHYRKITVVNLYEMLYAKNSVQKRIYDINLGNYDKILLIYGLESLNLDEQFQNLKFFKNYSLKNMRW